MKTTTEKRQENLATDSGTSHATPAQTIQSTLARIHPLDERAMRQARERWDAIAKPPGSLGKAEDLLTQIAGITGSADICLDKKALLVFCADNGVVAEGVTSNPPGITPIMAKHIMEGKSCVALMCRETGTALYPVDIGMHTEVPGLLTRKTQNGTNNMAKEPAMTREAAEEAILVGIDMVCERKEAGCDLLAMGEMGIGNTTSSAAVASVLLNLPPERTVGMGAGLSEEGIARKNRAVESAIRVNKPDPKDPIDVLAKVGGFDIAGMCGSCLACAAYRIPIVMDGFIAGVAALIAARLCPTVADYILPSHTSAEPAAKLILEELKKEPVLNAGFRLGEGTGALALFPLLSMSVTIYNEMITFDDLR